MLVLRTPSEPLITIGVCDGEDGYMVYPRPIPVLSRRFQVRDLLEAMKGARLIGELRENGEIIRHYLLPCGNVLEIVREDDAEE